jgi:hypothetical protein
MKAFMLATTQETDDKQDIDLLIGHSANPERDAENREYMTMGAFRPGKDGNYYHDLCLGFTLTSSEGLRDSFSDWWAWVKEALASGDVKMDPDFEFNPDQVKIIEVEIPIR